MIVLIDDDQISNFVCANMIEAIIPSQKVETFMDPIKGLAFILANASSINVLLLDLNMPVLDGWGILDQMQTEKLAIPVLILTSSVSVTDKQRAENYKVVKSVIRKPINKDLLNDIGQLL